MPRSPRSYRRFLAVTALGSALSVGATAARGQAVPSLVTRSSAIQASLAHSARGTIAAADTALAYAAILTARAFQNPTLSANYSKSVPQYHVALDVPLDLPGLRGSRIGSAEAARTSAQLRYRLARASIAFDADTTYTRTLTAREHSRLSAHNARDADSLLSMAVERQRAGDASNLDVELARVNAGQQENLAAADSLAYAATLIDLQTLMGISGPAGYLVPSDSLMPLTLDSSLSAHIHGNTLDVAAANASLASAELATRLQRKSLFASPSLTAGFETRDPTGAERGILPTLGVAIPLPLFNRNHGPITEALAAQQRATAELELARIESANSIERVRRTYTTTIARVNRDHALNESADRVASMSMTAYREGAATLASVLEAQRNSREVRGQYVDDLAAAWIASATLRLVSLTDESYRNDDSKVIGR